MNTPQPTLVALAEAHDSRNVSELVKFVASLTCQLADVVFELHQQRNKLEETVRRLDDYVAASKGNR